MGNSASTQARAAPRARANAERGRAALRATFSGSVRHIEAKLSSLSLGGREKKPFELRVTPPVRKAAALPRERIVENDLRVEAELEAASYPSRKWNTELDRKLVASVHLHNANDWKKIAANVPGMSHTQCLQRWKKVLKPGLKKGKWEPEEDATLLELVPRAIVQHGGIQTVNWVSCADHIPGRTAKQCRERYTLNLDPSIDQSPWRPEEDRVLQDLHARLGNRWADIASRMPGRTENAVKTHMKSLQRRADRAWTAGEDRAVIDARAHGSGAGWEDAAIAAFPARAALPPRSRNAVKQRFRTLCKHLEGLEAAVQFGPRYMDHLPESTRNTLLSPPAPFETGVADMFPQFETTHVAPPPGVLAWGVEIDSRNNDHLAFDDTQQQPQQPQQQPPQQQPGYSFGEPVDPLLLMEPGSSWLSVPDDFFSTAAPDAPPPSPPQQPRTQAPPRPQMPSPAATPPAASRLSGLSAWEPAGPDMTKPPSQERFVSAEGSSLPRPLYDAQGMSSNGFNDSEKEILRQTLLVPAADLAVV